MRDLSKLPPPERLPVLEDDVTLRDRFAMAALTGVIQMVGEEMGDGCADPDKFRVIAQEAYRLADEMLEARK
jgi:hypothetical protein